MRRCSRMGRLAGLAAVAGVLAVAMACGGPPSLVVSHTGDPGVPAARTGASSAYDAASGTIVMGDNVRISTVAIAQGNLTIRVTEAPQVSQPNPLAGGATVVVPRTRIQVDDQRDNKLGVLDSGVTLRDLVTSLNALGVGPRDLISILQAIKAAGALQADLQVR